MARNIEIKARVSDMDALLKKAMSISSGTPLEIEQDDTFFHCPQGRLKLRAFTDETGLLVFYRRADTQGPKESFYQLTATREPDALRETLALAYGVAGRVVKQRTLLLAGRTRIHLDRVQGLGEFMELEVVLDADDSLEGGMEEARTVMAQLGIQASQLVEGAYLDLLAQTAQKPA